MTFLGAPSVSDQSANSSGGRKERVLTLARHEYRAALRSRILISLLTILVTVTFASVYIGSVAHRSQVADYQAYRDAATASGLSKIAPSPLAPMSLLRGALEYLQIIGAVIAITLGYLSVSRERANRTMALVRSRPVTAGEFTAGNLLGAAAIIATLVGATAVVGIVSIGLVGNDWIGGGEALRVVFAYASAVVYMLGFYAVGAIATSKSRVAANGLIMALAVWLVLVLVTPQIGDTLDMDNQVPGGLFKALNLSRADETTLLTHFDLYETVRTRIEWVSFAQHFQRFAFGMVEVKERYRHHSIGWLFGRVWTDLAFVLIIPGVLITWLKRTFRTQPSIPQGAH
jgi:ABC-type transport system involved in multi-copper enzyme maturation permease subunit